MRPLFTLEIASCIRGCALRSRSAPRFHRRQPSHCHEATTALDVRPRPLRVAPRRPAGFDLISIRSCQVNDSTFLGEKEVMTRKCATMTFVIASITAALVAACYPLQQQGIVVSASEAASIRGGQCGQYAMMAQGACGDGASDTCTSSSTDCDGLCPLRCVPKSTYGGSGTFTGSLIGGVCDTAPQPTCTATTCTAGGITVPCCTCSGGSNVQCGPAPYALNSNGCSGS